VHAKSTGDLISLWIQRSLSPKFGLGELRCKNDFTLLVNFHVPRFSTEFGKRSFSYMAPTAWNGPPLNIRLSPTFDTFKRRLKTHLFKQPINTLTMLPT